MYVCTTNRTLAVPTLVIVIIVLITVNTSSTDNIMMLMKRLRYSHITFLAKIMQLLFNIAIYSYLTIVEDLDTF